MKNELLSHWLGKGYVLLLLCFFFFPMLLPFVRLIEATPEGQGYLAFLLSTFDDNRVVASAKTSVLIAAVVGVVTPVLAILIAHAIRELNIPRLILAIVLTPLFIPGISMGVGSALLFQTMGIRPSLMTMIFVQVLWALPFATLVLLTTLSRFNPRYLEASYMLGKNRLQTFFKVELPNIFPGILGAAVFSFILSFNETIRTAVVQGPNNTLQTYLWSQYQQVGLSPSIYNMMIIIIALTLVLIGVMAALDYRARGR